MPLFLQFVIEKITEISTVTKDDYISMVSTFTAVTNLQFNCGTCCKKYPKLPLKLLEHQSRLGCDGKKNPQLTYTATHDMIGSPKILFKKCIGNFFDNKSMDLIKYFSKYKAGMMPYNGSYYDQPNKFVELMELVDNLVEQNNKEREEKLSRHQGRHGRK